MSQGCTTPPQPAAELDQQRLTEILAELSATAPSGTVNWVGVRVASDATFDVSVLPAGADEVATVDESGALTRSTTFERHPVGGDLSTLRPEWARVRGDCPAAHTYAARPLPSGEWLEYWGCAESAVDLEPGMAPYGAASAAIGEHLLDPMGQWGTAEDLERILATVTLALGDPPLSTLTFRDTTDDAALNVLTGADTDDGQCTQAANAWHLSWFAEPVPEGSPPIQVACALAQGPESFHLTELSAGQLGHTVALAAADQGLSVDEVTHMYLYPRDSELAAQIGVEPTYTLEEHRYHVTER